MVLVYPIKIKSEGKVITGLVSPHLRVDFITSYFDSIKEASTSSLALTTETLEMEILQIVMEDYVKWIKSSNYILRIPAHSRIDFLQPGEQWINVQLSVAIEKGPVEYMSKAFGILLFLTTAALGEFSFIIAARFDKVSYTKIILPILTDFIMAAVIYVYSGTAANMDIKGKELDDWWYNRMPSPTEIELEKENHSLFSSWGLSKLMLHTLPLLYTLFKYIGYWQGMMAMRDEVKASSLDDQIISPKFVYNFAIVGTSIGAAYTIAQCTSLSLQATDVLKNLLDKCYNFYIEKAKCIKKQNYARVLTADGEETESGDKLGAIVDASTKVILSPFDVETHIENNSKKPEEKHTVFFVTEIIYNNLLINKQELLNKVFQKSGVKAVQDIINLGEDYDVASAILEAAEKYGIEHVVKILFGDAETHSAFKEFTKESLHIEGSSKESTIESIFFLDSDRGIEFVQTVVNNFGQEALITIIELAKDQSIVEQILFEIEIQGIDKVINILLGRKERAVDLTENLENIIGYQELNQLRLIPNGIFNNWSNKAYQKIVEYIDSFAKSFDDLLSAGITGNQVTITLVMLEELLMFAASNQKFVGGGRPYYNPADDEPNWLYGIGSNNDSDVSVFDDHGEFIGLLPYNNSLNDSINYTH